jgi:YD repeat-containing protein
VSLSGVRFADPRGLAIGPTSGVLYLADRRRHIVYAIHPETAGGAIGGASTVEPIIGDGGMGMYHPLGERYPGTRLSMREPAGLALAEDGTLLVMSQGGVVAYEPAAKEGEWLFRIGAQEEIINAPNFWKFVALTSSSILTVTNTDILGRYDVDRLSSEFEPTRTIRRLTGGELELVDTQNETVERFDAAGRLVETKKRTGETMMTVTYADATSDKVTKITDAVGGENVFTYDANGKIDRFTDARGRITELTVSGIGDLTTVVTPANETHAFVYDEHHMTEKRSPRNDLTSYTYRTDGTIESATKPEGAVTTIDAALSHPPSYDADGKLERQGIFTDAHGVTHTVVINRRGDIEKDTLCRRWRHARRDRHLPNGYV